MHAASFRDGRIVDPEFEGTVRIKFGFAASGGYRASEGALPPAVRRFSAETVVVASSAANRDVRSSTSRAEDTGI